MYWWNRHTEPSSADRNRMTTPRALTKDQGTLAVGVVVTDTKVQCRREQYSPTVTDDSDNQQGSAVKRKNKVSIFIAAMTFSALGIAVVHAQGKYSLLSPSGIAFADFKGYEDWSVVSSARTADVLKVILGNPLMIKAY